MSQFTYHLYYGISSLKLFSLFQEPGVVEHISQNITRQGLTDNTLHFLQVSFFIAFQGMK